VPSIPKDYSTVKFHCPQCLIQYEVACFVTHVGNDYTFDPHPSHCGAAMIAMQFSAHSQDQMRAIQKAMNTAFQAGIPISTTSHAKAITDLLGENREIMFPGLEDLGIKTEPILAYRDWKVVYHECSARYRLSSRNGAIWPPCQKLIAICRPFDEHDAPDENCNKECGIYAWNEPSRSLHGDIQAFGEVYLWGEILIAPEGYRAEFAYPKRIWLKNTGRRRLADMRLMLEEDYWIPVEIAGADGY